MQLQLGSGDARKSEEKSRDRVAVGLKPPDEGICTTILRILSQYSVCRRSKQKKKRTRKRKRRKPEHAKGEKQTSGT
jgi:hypothetical protein